MLLASQLDRVEEKFDDDYGILHNIAPKNKDYETVLPQKSICRVMASSLGSYGNNRHGVKVILDEGVIDEDLRLATLARRREGLNHYPAEQIHSLVIIDLI